MRTLRAPRVTTRLPSRPSHDGFPTKLSAATMATPRRRRHRVACSKSADNQESGNEQAEWSEYNAAPVVRPAEASVREVDQCSDTERDEHRHDDEGTERTKPVAAASSHVVIGPRPYRCAARRRERRSNLAGDTAPCARTKPPAGCWTVCSGETMTALPGRYCSSSA